MKLAAQYGDPASFGLPCVTNRAGDYCVCKRCVAAAAGAWRRVLLLLLVAGLVRAGHHFIRLAILAVLGLAGLYMLHTLAQDYNKISNRPARPAVAATRALFKAITKREVGEHRAEHQESDYMGPMGRVLRRVLLRDPLGCARKLVCQLSAADPGPGEQGLQPHEAAILRLVRRSAEEEDGGEAAAEFRTAQRLGKSSRDPGQCARRYSGCSVEPRAVLKLLQSVG